MQYEFEMVKSKRIWVPPSKGRKGYYREDPREKSVLDALKGLLRRIIGMKRKGPLINEQRVHIHKTLKELEPRMKYFKTQKQKMEVAKVIKQIRAELVVKGDKRIIDKLWEDKYKQEWAKKQKQAEKTVLSKDGQDIPDEFKDGLKKLGYVAGDMKSKSLHEIKAIYYNDIRKE